MTGFGHGSLGIKEHRHVVIVAEVSHGGVCFQTAGSGLDEPMRAIVPRDFVLCPVRVETAPSALGLHMILHRSD